MERTVRARVREDRRVLELPEPLPPGAGGEVYVILTGLPEEPIGTRTRAAHLPTRRLGPMKRAVTREEAYGDLE